MSAKIRYFDAEKAKALRQQGYTYDAIAKEFGVSRQYVWSKIVGGTHNSDLDFIIYPNLRNWMRKNGYSVMALAAKIGLSNYRIMSRRLSGRTQFKMNEIDEILKLAKMSYEECFATN